MTQKRRSIGFGMIAAGLAFVGVSVYLVRKVAIKGAAVEVTPESVEEKLIIDADGNIQE